MIRPGWNMIRVGILLCLGVTWSQGKPSKDASDVLPAKRLAADADVDVNDGQVLPFSQMYFFRIGGKSYVQAFTKTELGPDEAQIKCQQLGSVLGCAGDLAAFTKTENVPKFGLVTSWNFNYKQYIMARKVLEQINEMSGGFVRSWTRTINGNTCSYLYGAHNSVFQGNSEICKGKYNKSDTFVCQFS